MHQPIPSERSDLQEAAHAFASWRESKPTKRTRIPEKHWELACHLAKTHGIAKASREPKLDYYRLKEAARRPLTRNCLVQHSPSRVQAAATIQDVARLCPASNSGHQRNHRVRGGTRNRQRHSFRAPVEGKHRARSDCPQPTPHARPVIMLQVTPHTRILVAIEPADFRKGIDGLARQCKELLQEAPFSGTMFVFRNRRGTAVKLLMYDGQGFWLCQKRLSTGRSARKRSPGRWFFKPERW